MPIIKSAKKRVKQTEKATIRNAKSKRTLREAVKAFTLALSGGKASEISKAQAEAYSAIDKAAKKNILHKNKAARKKAQLNTRARAVAGGAARPKAPRAKKPVESKTAAPKKPAVKKSPAKKTVAKK